jgi:hypothetical protein
MSRTRDRRGAKAELLVDGDLVGDGAAVLMIGLSCRRSSPCVTVYVRATSLSASYPAI